MLVYGQDWEVIQEDLRVMERVEIRKTRRECSKKRQWPRVIYAIVRQIMAEMKAEIKT